MDRRAADLELARSVFGSLELPDWVEDTDQLKGGGQAAVLVVRHKNGDRGVFRYLRSSQAKHLARFFREVEILTRAEFQHPSIVNLLDWTKDGTTPWYISELGRSFEDSWEAIRESNAGSPVVLLSRAIGCLLSIADGLSRLHKAGCVHRDIKPGNLIILGEGDDERPALIDFGLAFVKHAERLTEPDEAVGNRRFSPDVAMSRMETVTPWLDVFQLSQLLMWMVANRSPKDHWSRPVDWRWVDYPDQLGGDLITAVKAVTALCSEEALSPKDAGELHSLLKARFPTSSSRRGISGELQFDVDAIQSVLATGKSEHDVIVTQEHKAITAAAPDAERFHSELLSKLDSLVAKAQSQGFDCQTMPSRTLTQHIDTILTNRSHSLEGRTYEIQCGRKTGRTAMTLSIQCHVYVPGERSKRWPPLPPSSNPFVFSIFRHVHDRDVIPRTYTRFTLENDGRVTLRDGQMKSIRTVTLDEIVLEVKAMMEDKQAWKEMARPRW